jgi:hypothetical protein
MPVCGISSLLILLKNYKGMIYMTVRFSCRVDENQARLRLRRGGEKRKQRQQCHQGKQGNFVDRISYVVYRISSGVRKTMDYGLLTLVLDCARTIRRRSYVVCRRSICELITRSTSPNPSPPTPRLRRARGRGIGFHWIASLRSQ